VSASNRASDLFKVGDPVEYSDTGLLSDRSRIFRGTVASFTPDGFPVVEVRDRGRKWLRTFDGGGFGSPALRSVDGTSTYTAPSTFMKGFKNTIAAMFLVPAVAGAGVGAFAGSKYKKVGPYYGAGLGVVGAVAATVLVTRFLNQPTKSPVPVLKVAGIESYDVDDLPTYLRQAFSEAREELGLEDLPAFGPWAPTEAEIEAISEAKRRSASAHEVKGYDVGSLATTAWFRPSDVIPPRVGPYKRPNLLKILQATPRRK
jgi:hypothetical protein